jgi:hypothetical protein
MDFVGAELDAGRERHHYLVGTRTFSSSNQFRLVAIVSLTLWFTVAAAGRWIGFS